MKKSLVVTASIMLVAAACNKQAVVQPAPDPASTTHQVSFSGKLVVNVLGCQLFQTDDGKVYTLEGNHLDLFKAGDAVNILGDLRQVHGCDQDSGTIGLSTITYSDPTTNQKTYTNAQYGFGFKYSAFWIERSLASLTGSVIVSFNDLNSETLILISTINNSTKSDLIKNSISSEQIKIGGVPATHVIHSEEGAGEDYILEHNGTIFDLGVFPARDDNNALFITTFKFTK